ncbi:MAG: GtrA family protein [Pseudomonadales bacterium]
MNTNTEHYVKLGNKQQILRFILVGGMTAVVYYGVLYTLVEFLGMAVLFSSSAAYIGAIILNYKLHHAWTFEARVSHNVATTRYLVMCVIGFTINYLVMFFGLSDDQSNYLLVQTAAVVCVVSWNFVMSSLWVYRHS